MKLSKFFIAIAAVFFVGCIMTSTEQIETYPIGKLYQGTINLQDMDIPLPEGKWIVIGRGLFMDNKFIEISLFNPENKDGLVITRDSIINDASRGYVPSNYLNRGDLHHSVVINNKGGESQEGWLINHYRLSLNPEGRQAIKETYQYIVDNKLTLAGNYIQIFHRFTESHNKKFLEYSHFVNPESAGFEPPANVEWPSSDWHPLKINSSPEKIEYIEKLKKEGASMHEKLKIAFGN